MTRLIRLVILGGLLAVAAGCNGTDEPQPQKALAQADTSGVSGTVTLTIVPGVEGRKADPPSPLAGTTIKLRRQGDAQALAETTTDKAGRFRFVVEPGTYDIELHDPVGSLYRESVRVTQGRIHEIRIGLLLCAP